MTAATANLQRGFRVVIRDYTQGGEEVLEPATLIRSRRCIDGTFELWEVRFDDGDVRNRWVDTTEAHDYLLAKLAGNLQR